MKILKKGQPMDWWHGKKITCTVCGQEMELEKEDEQRPFWIVSAFKSVRLGCTNCNQVLKLERP